MLQKAHACLRIRYALQRGAYRRNVPSCRKYHCLRAFGQSRNAIITHL
ncbi:hypothetical protein SS05631_c22120 [Sinorhizobium sp. CCBAU 05631]|nr:hypothetical protein SS05631_c22120 [Sinorhizobium sp. CCBAU 05631]